MKMQNDKMLEASMKIGAKGFSGVPPHKRFASMNNREPEIVESQTSMKR